MSEPEQPSEPVEELGHADSSENLSTPDGDDQVEPGAQPWTAEDDDQAAEAQQTAGGGDAES